MRENSDKIKTQIQDVVFVCEQSLIAADRTKLPIIAWPADPDAPNSIFEFLAESEIRGWAIWISSTTAYVYAPNAEAAA